MPWRDDLQGVTAVVAVSPSENQSQLKYITGEIYHRWTQINPPV